MQLVNKRYKYFINSWLTWVDSSFFSAREYNKEKYPINLIILEEK